MSILLKFLHKFEFKNFNFYINPQEKQVYYFLKFLKKKMN